MHIAANEVLIVANNWYGKKYIKIRNNGPSILTTKYTNIRVQYM